MFIFLLWNYYKKVIFTILLSVLYQIDFIVKKALFLNLFFCVDKSCENIFLIAF